MAPPFRPPEPSNVSVEADGWIIVAALVAAGSSFVAACSPEQQSPMSLTSVYRDLRTYRMGGRDSDATSTCRLHLYRGSWKSH